jgi:hypothetical protein
MIFGTLPSLVAIALACAFAGCSGGGSQSVDSGATDAVGTTDRGSGSDGGGTTCLNQPDLTAPTPMCNRAVNNARAVPFMARTGTPPAPTGGVIADGVYVSTATEGYGVITPAGRRITLVVLAGATKMLWTGEVLDATGATVSQAFTANTDISASGNQINFTVGCASTSPPPVPAALTYTATAGQLVLSLITGANTAVTTYMRTGCP